MFGPFALGCFAEVGYAPHSDAPYDDDDVGVTTQALELDRDGAYVISQEASASHQVFGSTYNSRGGRNYVERAAVGRYLVHLEDLEKSDGNVQVVAYGIDDSYRCKVYGWSPTSTRYPGSLAVSVRCHNVAGNPADSRFAMTFLGKHPHGETVDAGFVWTSSSTASHTALSRFSDVGGGRPINVNRDGLGRYTVSFRTEEQAFILGFPQVTAYGPGPEYCTISNVAFLPGVYGVSVSVNCFDRTGALADSLFSLLWTSFGLWDYSPWTASIYANRETTAEYDPGHQTGIYDTTITAFRSSTGTYSFVPLDVAVRLPLATARATNGNYCKIASRSGDEVNVRCYDKNGTRADTRYYGTVFEAP